MRRILLMTGVLAAFGLGAGAPAHAQQSFTPTKNSEIIIGLAPGGQLDRIGRTLQRALQETKIVTTPVSVVNKPGAGMLIGVNYLNTHPGDGHYVMVMGMSWLAALAARGEPGYRDVTPIMKMITDNQVFVVGANSDLKAPSDLVTKLKKDPASVSFDFNSRGSVEHLAAMKFAKVAGADPSKLRIVIFESGSVAATEVAGGHVDVNIGSIGSAVSLIDAGKLRVLGVAGAQRLPGAYDKYPTFREQGVDVVSNTSYGLIGPKGMTPAQVAFWENAITKAIESDVGKSAAAGETWRFDLVRHEGAAKWLEQDYNEIRGAQVEAGLAK